MLAAPSARADQVSLRAEEVARRSDEASDSADPRWPGARRWSAAAELSYTRHREHAAATSLVSPLLTLHYGLDERFSIGVDWGMAAVFAAPREGSVDRRAVGGNPYVTAHYGDRLGTWRWRVGLGATLPLARAAPGDDGRLKLAAYNWAMNARGLWNAWLFAPERSAIVLPAEIEHDVGKGFWFRAETAAALTVPVQAFAGSEDLIVQGAASLGGYQGPVRFGVRLLGVGLLTHSQDRLQVAVEPLVRVAIGDGFLSARYTFNVGEPLGQRRGLRVWGAHLGGGLQF